MRVCHVRMLALSVSVCLLVGQSQAPAQDTVAGYVDLAIARLELARDTWTEHQRSPTAQEEAALFRTHATTSRQFYAFAGKRRKEIDAYLQAHPDLLARIQTLSDQVRALIEQKEVK